MHASVLETQALQEAIDSRHKLHRLGMELYERIREQDIYFARESWVSYAL